MAATVNNVQASIANNAGVNTLANMVVDQGGDNVLISANGRESGHASAQVSGVDHGADALTLLSDGTTSAEEINGSGTVNAVSTWGRMAPSDQTADLVATWVSDNHDTGQIGAEIAGIDDTVGATGVDKVINTDDATSPHNVTITVSGPALITLNVEAGNGVTFDVSDESEAGTTIQAQHTPQSSGQALLTLRVASAGTYTIGVKWNGSAFRMISNAIAFLEVSGGVLISGLTASGVAGKAEPVAIKGSLSFTELAAAVAGKAEPGTVLGSTSASTSVEAIAGRSGPGVVLGSTQASPVVSAVAGRAGPAVQFGSTSVTALVDAVAGRADPIVVKGPLALGGTASAVAGKVDPVAIKGPLSLTELVSAIAGRAGPAVLLGSTAASPVAGAMAGRAGPTVVKGSLILTAVAAAVAGKANPTVAAGGIIVSGRLAEGFSGRAGPAVLLGSTAATAIAQAIAGRAGPAVLLGSVLAMPAPAESVAARAAPAVVLGPLTLTAVVEAPIGTAGPIVLKGSLTLGGLAEAVAGKADPTVPASGVTVTGALAEAVGDRAGPAVVLGSLALSAVIEALGGTRDPAVVIPTDALSAPRYLVEIQFDSGTTRLWNGLGTLTALGESWTGVGRLGSISPIRDTQDVVASGVAFELTIIPTPEIPDAPDAFLNLALQEEYQGRPVTVYRAFLDPDDGRTLLKDPEPRFKGYLDVMEDVEAPGAAILRVMAENRLIDLERPRKRTYTPEDQKARYPGDTFFDEVAALQNREIILK